MSKTDMSSLPATAAEASQGASPGVSTGDWFDSEHIEIPAKWKPSDRIMGALNTARHAIKRRDLLERIAEAKRVDNASGPTWHSQAVRENYLACIIEGKILIGS